jgi:hypothetical protein
LPEQFDFRRCHWFVHFLLLLAVGRWDWAIGNSPVLHALGIGRMSPRFCFVSFVSGLAKTTRGHEQIASGTPAGGLEKDCPCIRSPAQSNVSLLCISDGRALATIARKNVNGNQISLMSALGQKHTSAGQKGMPLYR